MTTSTAEDQIADLPALRAAYSRFLIGGRVLLTGHSHQAWPDAAREALLASFDDAARFVDDKWDEAVFPRMKAVGEGVLARMGFDAGDAIAFGKNTHELVYRLVTCLPLRERPRIVTTRSEFHSLRRQLTRLEEEGVQVTWVEAQPRADLADRILAAIEPGTAMLAMSAVLFDDGFVVPRIGEIAAKAVGVGAIALIDAYHAFNVVPIDWGPARDRLYVTAGGYKYAGFGEGVCWLRFPSDSTLRPVYTGWYADFGVLDRHHGGPTPVSLGNPAGVPQTPPARADTAVRYGPGGARFAGATFDPSAIYRAHAVLAHWDRFGLTPERLRAISRRQTRRILDRLDAHGLGDRVMSPRDDARRGGFVAVRATPAGPTGLSTMGAPPAPQTPPAPPPTPRGAEAIVRRLRAEGVLVDARNETLRLGPGPYLTDDEIDRGVEAVARALVSTV
jgi:selenocysteine lyase/cysteine desulfurase